MTNLMQSTYRNDFVRHVSHFLMRETHTLPLLLFTAPQNCPRSIQQRPEEAMDHSSKMMRERSTYG